MNQANQHDDGNPTDMDSLVGSDIVMDHFRLKEEERELKYNIQEKLYFVYTQPEAAMFREIIHNLYVDSSIGLVAHSRLKFLPPEEQPAAVEKNLAKLRQIQKDLDAIAVYREKGESKAEYDIMRRRLVVELFRIRKVQNKSGESLPYALLTPGTTFITDQNLHGRKGHEFTVKCLHQNGTNSFVVETTTKRSAEEFAALGMEYESFNISYVAKVLKHKPGKLVIDEQKMHHTTIFNLGRIKPKSQYVTSQLNMLVAYVYKNLGLHDDHSEAVCFENIVRELVIKGVLRETKVGEYNWVYSTSKKKFKAAVRRIANRHKLPLKQREKEERDYYAKQAAADYDDIYID